MHGRFLRVRAIRVRPICRRPAVSGLLLAAVLCTGAPATAGVETVTVRLEEARCFS
jgi:hypothetical protein